MKFEGIEMKCFNDLLMEVHCLVGSSLDWSRISAFPVAVVAFHPNSLDPVDSLTYQWVFHRPVD
jgi:hypothetical protein